MTANVLGFNPVSSYFIAGGKERMMMNLFSASDLVLQSTGEEDISHAVFETPLTLSLYGHTDSERLFSSQTPHRISVQS